MGRRLRSSTRAGSGSWTTRKAGTSSRVRRGIKLKSSGKRVFLAVNKVDNAGRARNEAEFAELGFDKTFSIAAVHGTGVEALLDAATEAFSTNMTPETARTPRIAI